MVPELAATPSLSSVCVWHKSTRQKSRPKQVAKPETSSSKRSAALAKVVLQTADTDFHGRYVANVLCAKAEVTIDDCFEEGVHLN
jgi:hypothetical protein